MSARPLQPIRLGLWGARVAFGFRRMASAQDWSAHLLHAIGEIRRLGGDLPPGQPDA